MTLGGPGEGWGSGSGWGTDGDTGVSPPVSGAPDGASPRLQPLGIGGLLEVAARIVRRHARPLLAVSLLFQLPSALVDAVTQQQLGRALAPLVVGGAGDAPTFLAPTAAQTRTILEALVGLAGSSVVGTLLGALATLAFTTAVLADYRGIRPTTGGMVHAALRRAIPALVAGLLASLALLAVIVGAGLLASAALAVLPATDGGGLGAFLAIVVGVAAVVLAVVVVVRLAFPAAVLAGEPGGALRSLRRSWSLTEGNTWRAFAVLGIVALALAIVGSTLLELLATVITDGLAAGVGLADLSDAVLSGLVATLLAPIGGVVLAVLYLDLRVRREGWQPEAQAPTDQA